MTDRERLIALNLLSDIGSLRTTRLLEAFGSLQAVWEASESELQRVEGVGPALDARVAAVRRDRPRLADEVALAAREGCAIVTRIEAAYPSPLRAIHDPPLALYLRGRWQDEDQAAVAIVGSRRGSIYGLQMAERLAYDLALRGVTIVSGLARGVDAAAHRGALKAGGRTIAVLGNGLASVYPPEHAELAEQIAAQGALASEYPMRMEPLAQNFPRRNRLISGLSLGVVIVEAAQRSGALITADCALEQGKEVFAVPGRADAWSAQGTNQLLKQGAKLVTTVEDIVEELRLEPVAMTNQTIPGEASSHPAASEAANDQEAVLLRHLTAEEPREFDRLASASGLPASACASLLLQLELKRLVKQLPGNRFILTG